MTPEEQRIAIAEACGWKFWTNIHGTWVATRPDGKEVAMPGTPVQAVVGILDKFGLPNYHGDLNACAAMEKALTDAQWEDYIWNLNQICGHGDRPRISATAPQRCGSFLRTLGGWKE
jgi:hypothetical protein